MQFNRKTQIIYSLDGHLRSTEGMATDFDAVVKAIPESGGPIVLWFHGGLISTKSGIEIANRVGGFYASGYPGVEDAMKIHLPIDPYAIFFVWESGPGKSLMDALVAILERSLVTTAVKKLASLIGFKLTFVASLGLEGHEAATSSNELTEDEKAILFDALMSDSDFVAELNALYGPRIAVAPGAVGQDEAQAQATRAIDEFIEENLDADVNRSLSFSVGWAIVMGMAKIAKRVLIRIHNGRGHDTLQTVIEETVRELQIPQVWQEMKRYTDEAFEPDGVGTLFLRALKSRPDLAGRQIILVGHSTGAIYISNLLKCSEADGLRFEVRFLAPAIRFDRFAADLPSASSRIASFRTYGMDDGTERKESLLNVGPLERVGFVRDLYKGSLLYMVSGALESNKEGDPKSGGYGDCPLLGMERFVLQGADLSSSETTARDFVKATLSGGVWVYGPTKEGAPYPCASETHGGFDDIHEETKAPEAALWSLLLK